jgi:hypothetical protein
MSPTPTALIPEIPSDETDPVPTSKQTTESVSPGTLLLFDKLQSWFTEALDKTTATITSQLDERLKNCERSADQHRQQLTARLDTLEGGAPTVQMTAPSEMHSHDKAPSSPRSQMNQFMEQLGDRIDTLTNAVTTLQQKTGTDKPTKESNNTRSRRSKPKPSSRRYNKSSSSSSASESSDSKHSSSDVDTDMEEEIQSSWMGPIFPGLAELHSRCSRFRVARSYRAYRLKKTSQRHSEKMAGRLTSLVKKIRLSLREYFDGSDPLSILTFLSSFKHGCDNGGISEGAATYLLPYFLEGAPQREMNNYISRRKAN